MLSDGPWKPPVQAILTACGSGSRLAIERRPFTGRCAALMLKMRRARRIPRSRARQSTARERRGCRHRLDPGSGLRQPWPSIITPMNALPILATQAAPDEPLAVIEAMILDLRRLRDREPAKEVRTAHQVAIDRLHSLIDRLNQPRPRTIALPAAPASAPSPAATPGPRDERHRARGGHQVRQPPEKRLLPAQRLRAAASRRPLHKSGEQRDRESGVPKIFRQRRSDQADCECAAEQGQRQRSGDNPPTLASIRRYTSIHSARLTAAMSVMRAVNCYRPPP